MRRSDFLLTEAQVERALTDKDVWVRTFCVFRLDFTITADQAERGLKDEDWYVRLALTRRSDFSPTPQQCERGLTDDDREVREDWEKRKDLSLDVSALERVITYREEHQLESLPPGVEHQLRNLAEYQKLKERVQLKDVGQGISRGVAL